MRTLHNRGGLHSPDTLIEQGDTPVNVKDLLDAAEFENSCEMCPDNVNSVNSDGDIEDGVGFKRSMYPNQYIRKNSDY